MLLGTADEVCFDVKLTTVEWAYEISWSIGSCQSSQDYTDNADFSQECCLPAGTYTLTCKDSYPDGWNGGFMEINGETYCDTFTDDEETTQVQI